MQKNGNVNFFMVVRGRGKFDKSLKNESYACTSFSPLVLAANMSVHSVKSIFGWVYWGLEILDSLDFFSCHFFMHFSAIIFANRFEIVFTLENVRDATSISSGLPSG